MFRALKKGLSVVKKTVIMVVVFIAIIQLFLYFMFADKQKVAIKPQNELRNEVYTTINNLESKKGYGKALADIYTSYACSLVGEGCEEKGKNIDQHYSKSLLGKMTGLIAAPYTSPPASGTYWVIAGLQNAGFVPQTMAAEGIGFAAIRPLSGIWSTMRNLSYMILVLVMVLIGFMVMFRMKLGAQTVISVESALPKIVISLLYITFSFAIAGFLIDLMYLLIFIGVSALLSADPTVSAADILKYQNTYAAASFGTIWDGMFPYQTKVPILGGIYQLQLLGSALFDLLPQWINSAIRMIAAFIIIKTGFNFFTSNEGLELGVVTRLLNNVAFLGTTLGGAPEAVMLPGLKLAILAITLPLVLIFGGGFLLGIFVIFTLFSLLFRIFFMLLAGYLKILLLVVFAPLFMLFEALPGKHAFAYWFRALLGELLVFPIVIYLLVFGKVIIDIQLSNNTVLWQPPFVSGGTGLKPESFVMILGMAIIFMIPDLVKMTREFLGFKGVPIGVGIGTFFSGASSPIGGLAGFGGQFYHIDHLITSLTGRNGLKGLLKSAAPEPVLKAKSSVEEGIKTTAGTVDASSLHP